MLKEVDHMFSQQKLGIQNVKAQAVEAALKSVIDEVFHRYLIAK